jgi:large subunit ribosomal protein L28
LAVGTGNNVSFSQRKTRRVWKVNEQRKSFYSDVLGKKLSINVTTHALRCIDKAGGLDNYILKSKERRLHDSDLAMSLRKEMRKALQNASKV